MKEAYDGSDGTDPKLKYYRLRTDITRKCTFMIHD